MDQQMLFEAIFKRKSIRKYAGPLDAVTMDSVRSRLNELDPMIPDIRTEFRILETDDVRGVFKADAPHYLAIYSEEKDG